MNAVGNVFTNWQIDEVSGEYSVDDCYAISVLNFLGNNEAKITKVAWN
ncbi:MAG: hypothetical protein ACI9EW_000461 [Cellvibrionaceae bacterium]|jgi:hypothetical protein